MNRRSFLKAAAAVPLAPMASMAAPVPLPQPGVGEVVAWLEAPLRGGCRVGKSLADDSIAKAMNQFFELYENKPGWSDILDALDG